jgi:hypothetical protein
MVFGTIVARWAEILVFQSRQFAVLKRRSGDQNEVSSVNVTFGCDGGRITLKTISWYTANPML